MSERQKYKDTALFDTQGLTPTDVEMLNRYYQFLGDKAEVATNAGFTVSRDDMHPSLRPYQKDIVDWALKRGRALIAASFGLGKTRMQCEIMRHVHARTQRPVLVVCPLGVKQEFVVKDGPAMGMLFRYVGNDIEAEIALEDTPYLITNYERVRDGQLSIGRPVQQECRDRSPTRTRRVICNCCHIWNESSGCGLLPGHYSSTSRLTWAMMTPALICQRLRLSGTV